MPPAFLSRLAFLFPFWLIYTRFVLATEVATDVVSHQIWGPRKKSWSLPMTILAGIMRDAGRHSNLVDIVRLVPFPPFNVAYSFSRLPYGCSWDLAALYLCRQMRSSRRSHSEFANENFEEFSQNSMSWKMARVNCPANGSSPSGYGSVYRPSGRHHNQTRAPILPSRPVSTTRESSCTSTAVSLPPDLPCAVTQSDSFWMFGHLRSILFI